MAVIVEGREAAGKGYVIKRITKRLNHRIARVVALGADVKRHDRLNYIHHLLQTIPCQQIPDEPVELPDLQKDLDCRVPPIERLRWVPEVYSSGGMGSGGDVGEGSRISRQRE